MLSENLKSNFWLLISACAVLCLFWEPEKSSTILMLFIFLIIAGFLMCHSKITIERRNNYQYIVSFIIALCIAAFGFFGFYKNWMQRAKAAKLASALHISLPLMVSLIAAVGVIAGMYSLFIFINAITLRAFRYFKGTEMSFQKHLPSMGSQLFTEKKDRLFVFAVLALSAGVIITICSKSSPLYPFNDWVDVNCFMTIGKGMLSGKLPYRDLYDQKGPLLYAMHALAAFISYDSFFGVYLIELVNAFFFLFFSYKSLKLFIGDRAVFWMPIVSALVYTSSAFCHGDSAEEMCLPLLAYAVYVGLKAVYQKMLPSIRECLLIGITSGCVFWIKFTLVGIYLGWFVALIIIWRLDRHFAAILKRTFTIASGVIISTIPWILYFVYHHALMDLFNGYFYENIFYYSSVEEEGNKLFGIIKNLYQAGWTNLKSSAFLALVLLILAFVWLFYTKQRRILLYFGSLVLFEMLFTYAGGRAYNYYSLDFFTFIVFGIAALDDLIRRKKFSIRPLVRQRYVAICIILISCFAYTSLFSSNVYYMNYAKEELPQYKFKEIIEKTPNAVVMNYKSYDFGLYMALGTVPDFRYFLILNGDNPAVEEAMEADLKAQVPDYIFSYDVAYPELDENGYVCCALEQFYYEGRIHVYLLYQRKNQ